MMWPFVSRYRIIQVGDEYAIKTWLGYFVDLEHPQFCWAKDDRWYNTSCWSTDRRKVGYIHGRLQA